MQSYSDLESDDPDIEQGAERWKEERNEKVLQKKEDCRRTTDGLCLKRIWLMLALISFGASLAGMIVVFKPYTELNQKYTSLSKKCTQIEQKMVMANSFKLIKPYFMEEIPNDATYSEYLQLKKKQCKDLPDNADFWSDKLKTERCLNGVENGVRVVPTLWYRQKKKNIS